MYSFEPSARINIVEHVTDILELCRLFFSPRGGFKPDEVRVTVRVHLNCLLLENTSYVEPHYLKKYTYAFFKK